MGALTDEVRQVQNPALGGVLLWRFVTGYSAACNSASGCPVPLLFPVLPVLFHHNTLEYVTSTVKASGLRGFAAKFTLARNDDSDILLLLNERTRALRALTWQSLQVALRARLVTLDIPSAAVFALTTTMPRTGVSERARKLARDAEKFGYWCGELTLAETSSILRIRF
jgi:hypothetical protein